MLTKTILLVDDNAVQATIRQTILKRSGYSVIAVLHPARALEQLRSTDLLSEIQLVITDHMMPGMSGSAFVQEVRRLKSDLPVLVISGMVEAFEEYEGLNVEFRVKPLQPDLLLDCIQQMIGIPEPDSLIQAAAAPVTA
jgi:CheY-like chemotaxis protein